MLRGVPCVGRTPSCAADSVELRILSARSFPRGKRCDAGFEQPDFDGGLSLSDDDDAYQQAEYIDELEYGVR
jgi:hypothetical protein